MAKTRFRNFFRIGGSARSNSEPANAPLPPRGQAKQTPLAQLCETLPSATEVPPSAGQPELPAQREPAVGRSVGEYASEALQLRESGRREEAEALLCEAIERFPAEPRPRVEWAALSHARRDWPEALRRWELVRVEFPKEAVAYALGAAAQRELGRYDEAEGLLTVARELFPDDLGIVNESAWLATHRRDWTEALRR